jgi:uncharacterized GH25 family protein
MLPKILLFSILLLLFIPGVAQEYWMQSEKFAIKPGEKLVVNLQAGENFKGERWSIDKNAIEVLQLHQLSTTLNLRDSVNIATKNDVTHTIKNEGTYLLSLQSDNFFLESDPARFNDFLKACGLDDILYQRQKNNSLTSPGKEQYAIHTKLLVQVGQKRDDTFKKVLGSPAEIIPLQNPYALKIGDKIRFKILIEGKPVFGARVKVWNRSDNRTTIQNIYTEKDGTIESIISAPGPWMVSVVSMVPSKQAAAEWQSYRASLVFGIDN